MRTKKKIKEWSKAATVAAIFAVLFSPIAAADSITHKFKSPSFGGINTSSHYLTIENQEFNRVLSVKEEAAALLEAVERDRNNTTLARFIRNLESRVYAQLSRQLVDNLFGETPSTHGTIELEGNTITYASDGDFITLTITDLDANITEISLPIGSFTF
tara:strand:+ start:566 stop:1042 length:477 start_codon:yes stop_codon:yes gene_type:complete